MIYQRLYCRLFSWPLVLSYLCSYTKSLAIQSQIHALFSNSISWPLVLLFSICTILPAPIQMAGQLDVAAAFGFCCAMEPPIAPSDGGAMLPCAPYYPMAAPLYHPMMIAAPPCYAPIHTGGSIVPCSHQTTLTGMAAPIAPYHSHPWIQFHGIEGDGDHWFSG